MKNKKRALRRHYQAVAKERGIRKMKMWGMIYLKDKHIGIHANTRCPCSCEMCGNPRRWWKRRTRQELKAAISEKEQIGDLE